MLDLLDKEIENMHQNSELRTFGIILYTEENPNILKLLRDDDYWNALDSASGEKFYIFSVKPKKGNFTFPKMKEGTLGLMKQIWDEPKDNKEILEIFEIKSTQKLPLFIIFTECDGHLLKKEIKIDEKNIDSSLQQLKEIFYKINNLSLKVDTKEEHVAQIHDKFIKILTDYKFSKTIFSLDGLFAKAKKYINSVE